MKDNETIRESFKRELEQAAKSPILDPAYRKKKLVLWAIRTTISVVLYILFWKHTWVQWSLLLTIPLSLLSLFIITGMPYLLERKMKRINKKIEDTDKLMTETIDE